MRSLIAVLFVVEVVVAACGSNPPKSSPIVNEGSAVPENCCCKANLATSEDGKPSFEMANRMECSTKHGDCVDDVQCNTNNPKPGE
jgi:hypothetical protein